jgi:putative Holliday junction resolvase
MKVMALDYGSARTGVAVSDPTGVIARPLCVIERVRSDAGLEALMQLVRDEDPEQLIVGLPLTLSGEHGEQARETDAFVERLRGAIAAPVETYDERFTSVLAAGGDDSVAAAHLLESFLQWQSR